MELLIRRRGIHILFIILENNTLILKRNLNKSQKSRRKRNTEKQQKNIEEESRGFSMEGKPYKEKYNGERLSRVSLCNVIFSIIHSK